MTKEEADQRYIKLARNYFDIDLTDPAHAHLLNPNENQNLPVPPANSNKQPDWPPVPAKSGENQNLQTSPPPPGPVPTGHGVIAPAHRSPRCEHVKPNGVRCGSPALRNNIYCYFHEIWRAESPRRPFRPDPNGALFKLPLLEDANAIQMALQQVLDSILANKLDLRRAHALLYGLQTAAANIKRTTFDSITSRTHLSTELK